MAAWGSSRSIRAKSSGSIPEGIRSPTLTRADPPSRGNRDLEDGLLAVFDVYDTETPWSGWSAGGGAEDLPPAVICYRIHS